MNIFFVTNITTIIIEFIFLNSSKPITWFTKCKFTIVFIIIIFGYSNNLFIIHFFNINSYDIICIVNYANLSNRLNGELYKK